MPPKANGGKKNAFVNLCNTFADACSDAADEANDDPNELLDLLRSASQNNQQALNESDVAAIKVVNLLLPAVNLIAQKSVSKNFAPQNVKIKKMCAGIRINAYQIDKQNQYSRKENLRIMGMQEVDEEIVTDILQELFDSMKVKINTKTDIVACHRVGVKGTKPRTIIARFCTRDMKLQILVHKKGLKGSAKYGKVFIQEDLTTMRFKLLRFTKDLECVKTVATREGKIVCFLKNGGKIVVESPDDLFKLGVNNVNYKDFGVPDLDLDE